VICGFISVRLDGFAKSDENYNEAEQENVRKIAAYIGVK
jgi:hypothetical protein